MITGIITFLIIFAVIGSILYGIKLAKTEKIDAVFGNPERAKGGTHWIIVGSSFLLIAWLYYSWDLAKSFYPQSANELCQVAKVNDSMLSLKYLFPINEREFKSTSIIKAENSNIEKLTNEIRNSSVIRNQDKDRLLGFIQKTKRTIPLLTNEDLLENETKIKISELTNRIAWLTEDFQKISYPPIKSLEEENARIEALKIQGGWGSSGTAVENTIEIPTIPETKKGLKFDAAAKELTLISDDFFKLRNHNSQYKSLMKEIKDGIKKYRSELDDTQEVASILAKDVLKIARRIEYASIFPPKTLDTMQQAILEFDVIQKKEQGSLRLIDIFLFPTGTIISSGPNCSEQGSGRWLPKPSDTLKKFTLLLKPSVGFKNIPLIWYEMMDVSKVVGFILPDWIADIIPGKYPVHSDDGTVKPNFKSKVLNVVTGEFKLFKIPVPMGHIWDSFLRVFLGLILGIIFGVPLGFEFFFYDEFDSGRPGTFVTESITTTNIQFSEMSSSFDDLSVSGSISSSGGEILHFKGFSGLANNQPSASILYNFKVYPYSLTGGVAGIPRTVSKTQTFSKVSDGTAARKVSLVASSDVIVYDGDGIKVAPSGDVTLTATAINVSGSAFFTFLNNDGSTIQASSGDSTTTVGDLPATGSTKTFKVELRDGLATGTIVDTDSVTISGISEGATVYTAQLSNPASSVTVEVDGTTFFENTPTLIRAYKGGVELEFTEVYDEEAVDPTTFLPIGTFGQFSSSIHQISTYLTHNGGKVDATASELFGTSDGISNWNAPQQNTQGFIIFKVDFENGRGEQFIQQSFSAVFEGATGPGLVMRGEWTGSIDYIFDQGAKRRDAVFRDISGDVHYWGTTQAIPSGSEYLDLDNVYTLEPIYTSSTTQGDVDVNGWQYLGIQDFFVAAKLAIFEESFVKNTINVGTPPSGNPNAQIAIVGGTDEPYIAVGQTGVQGYGQEGVFIGMSNDSGSNGTTGILSLTSDASSGTYNQLAWDGDTLLIKGAIRQTAEGVVESRNLGLWDSTPASFSFRVGDIVSNENITWECILVHVKGVGNDEPGVGSSYTTYWEESNLAAKSVRLSADTQIFRVAQDGTITPSTITLTANRQNIGSPTSYTSVPSIVSGSTGDTATITPAQFGSNTSVTLTAAAGGFEDDMTIVKLQEGTDAITVVNSNQSHTLQTSEAGTVTYTDSGTTIQVFEGATALNFTTGFASPGIFTITTSASNISASTPSGNATDTATFGVHNSMNASQASIVYTIAGQKANGDTFTITTTQSFSKAIAGTSAETMRLSANGQSFVEGTNGVLTPDFIKFTANRENIGTTTSWTTSPSVTLYDASTGGSSTTTGDIVYLRKVDFGANTSITVTATAGGKSDEITVVRLTDGSNAITTILSNEAHTLNATSAGVVSDFTNSGTELVAYEGANQLTFQKPNTIVTNKLFRGLSLDTHDDADDGFQFLGGALASGTTADITNIWNVLAQLGVLWVYDYDSHGDYFTFNGTPTTQSDSAKVQSVTYVSGTTYKVTLASNYEMSGPSEENAFNFQFAAYDTDSAYQILTGALTTTLASSEFTIEFALYKGFTGAQFPSISGDNTKTGIVGDLTAFSNTIDNGFIAYVLKHIKANGEVVRTVKKQSFSKSKAGSDGAPGSGGAGVVFRGVYDSAKLYFQTAQRTDVVEGSDGNYYIVDEIGDSGTANWDNPVGGSDWTSFGAQFSSVATDILFATDVYADQTINIGSDGTNPVIALNADAGNSNANPYISIGQTVQSFLSGGIYLGYSQTNPVLSMVDDNNSSFFTYVGGQVSVSDASISGTGPQSVIRGPQLKVGRNSDVSNEDALNAYNFTVDTVGTVSASAAFIRGTVNATDGQIGEWLITPSSSADPLERGVLRDVDGEVRFNPNSGEVQLWSASLEYSSIEQSESSVVTVAASAEGAGNRFFIDGIESPTINLEYGNFLKGKFAPFKTHLDIPSYSLDLSDSSLSGHNFHFTAVAPGGAIRDGDDIFNKSTSLTTSEGDLFLIRTSSAAPGNSGAFIKISPSESFADISGEGGGGNLTGNTLYYYCTNHDSVSGTQVSMGGEVVLYPNGGAQTSTPNYKKIVTISSQQTLTGTAGLTDSFTWSGSTAANNTWADTSFDLPSPTSPPGPLFVSEEEFNIPNNTAVSLTEDSIRLTDVTIPPVSVKSSGITTGTSTVATPNYAPTYQYQVHGGILAQQGPQRGYRSAAISIQLIKDNDDVAKTIQLGGITAFGAKDAHSYWMSQDSNFESVVPETEIMLPNGNTKMAGECVVGDEILSWDYFNEIFSSATITNVRRRNVNTLYKVVIDGNEIEVSQNHKFFSFGNEGTTGQVSVDTLYNYQLANHGRFPTKTLIVWTKDGDSIKQGIVTKIEIVNRETEVITFTVPAFVNYISNNIISHNVFGGPGGYTWEQFNLYDGQAESGTQTQGSISTAFNTQVTQAANYRVRFRVLLTAGSAESINQPATNSNPTRTYHKFDSNFKHNNSSTGDVYFNGGYQSSVWGSTITIEKENNFIELNPAGLQVVSSADRFVQISRKVAGESTDGLLTVSDGSAIFKSLGNSDGANSAAQKAIETEGNITPITDNFWDLGMSAKRWDDIFATNGTINTSDETEKENITTSDLGLDFINELNPISYKFISGSRTHYGLGAQSVETVLESFEKDSMDFAGLITGSNYGLRYHEFISPMIKAIQQLSDKVSQLEAQISGSE